ncbi:hypothetical protein P3T37_001336 [Kitasatospora sp. MAA4]|uniref:DUF4232 domain-containing protein n=1 Tax=Kitasatospora sp. MAA4 TaxID=3035093 RepID=UPI002473167A|nr:DUF4232 domain-containing protein [Kitasatospora sp. MAA4]MDH6131951.1 hypothetical protein [Kitasatospora sp. MAA4]
MATTSTDNRRRILSLALLAAATTLALTACDGPNGSGSTAAAGGSGTVSSSPSSAATPVAPAGAGSHAPQSTAPISSSHRPTSTPTTLPTSPGNSDATSDSYAAKHPCAMDQLSLKTVYDAQLGATRRLIEVTDTGSTACGLDAYPLVAIEKASTINVGNGQAENVQPSVPNGSGGAPGYPLHAGRTAYAVVDLDPSHSTTGASRDYDELAVIASSDLPNADELDTKLTEEGGSAGNPYVKSPLLGLYRDTIAAAATSATG